jgi:hypothetical protein
MPPICQAAENAKLSVYAHYLSAYTPNMPHVKKFSAATANDCSNKNILTPALIGLGFQLQV